MPQRRRRLHALTALPLLLLAASTADAQLFWNQAAHFAGSASSYIAIPNSAGLNITGSFTIECWVRPASAATTGVLVQHRTGSAIEGYTLYLSSGRPAIRTGFDTRLRSTTVIPEGRWTHVAAVYESSVDQYAIYINGSIDTAATVASDPPPPSTDSLRIGTGFNGPFEGDLDEVRIWNWALESLQIGRHIRTSIAASGGIYQSLVLSLTFQDDEASGAPFSLADWSGHGNNGVNRGVTAVDHGFAPPVYLSWNEGVAVDGNNDYLAGPDAVAVSPVSAITIQAWVYPEETGTGVIVNKGFSTTTQSYRFFLTTGNVLRAGVNNTFVSATGSAPAGQWTHVAFTYSATGETYAFAINGEPAGSGTLSAGTIADGTDSLLIGGGGSLAEFHGYLDELRISDYAKTIAEIRSMMFVTMDQANEQGSAFTNVCYSLNGYATDACADGGPRLTFNGHAAFSLPATVNDVPVAPLGRAPSTAGFAAGYRMRSPDRRIPASGTAGAMIRDSIFCGQSVTIADLNLFLAANHTWEQDLDVALIGPAGDSVRVFGDWGFGGSDAAIVTIFDDDADSGYVFNRYLAPGPTIRPRYSLNAVFGGRNAQGWWILDVVDDASSDSGRLYGWGIQINNQTVVHAGEAPVPPASFRLAQNYPNPFNPVTTIEYDVPRTVPVTLEIFDLLGRLVERPVNEVQAPGTYRVRFPSARAASGTYFCRLRAGEHVQTMKMLLVK